jgi:molybdopterin-containing oxidoreductase family membrane subunit
MNTPSKQAIRSYPQFLWKSVGVATDGNWPFYTWMTALTAVMLVGVNAWAHQMVEGMGATAMSDHVSWGIYIANFAFTVGLAAGAVMMVIPAYIYDDERMRDVVIIGEILAVAAIVMSLAFVNVDIGRPDRLWHMLPLVGRFHWPVSMLTWDVLVLAGYLFLNLHICGYLLYMRFLGRKPAKSWYIPFVFVSIVWAISIHTVTAFLFSGLGGRPFWKTALLAPRFLVSAFVSGPAFIILAMQAIRRFGDVKFTMEPMWTMVKILQVTILINLFLLLSEVFTEFYTGGSHTAAAQYLFFGLHGHDALVPWIWTAIVCNVAAAFLLLTKQSKENLWLIDVGCALVFVGIWIEKGMGMVVPGFVPSTLHEIVEYMPNELEWRVVAGVWALGMMIFTLGIKIAIAVFTGKMHIEDDTPAEPVAEVA